jgi:hypothetical protein
MALTALALLPSIAPQLPAHAQRGAVGEPAPVSVAEGERWLSEGERALDFSNWVRQRTDDPQGSLHDSPLRACRRPNATDRSSP